MTPRRSRIRARVPLRYPGVLASAALAAAVVLAAGGCGPSAAPAKAVTGAYHGLTYAEAEAAYDSYVTASTAAARQGNATGGLAIVADAQWAVVNAEYTALASAGRPVAQYSYGTPVFYVPALSNYPQWFMVAVPTSTVTGGHPGPAVDTIMVFVRSGPGKTWTMNGSAVLDQPLPAIARDADGYAIDVATTDAGLLLPPNLVGASQAAVVDEGPASAAAAVIASGPQTTGLYAAQNAQADSDAARGLHYQWLLEGAAFAQWELQTADGGALVLYAMDLNTTTEHPGLVSGSPIPVPAAFSPLLAAPTEIGYHQVIADWIFQFAAVDPPLTARGAKVDIIAAGGGPVFGHAY